MIRLAATASLLAAVLALPAFAQDADAPLGDILEALPEEEKQTSEPAPPRRTVPVTGVGTADLPPSDVAGRIGEAEEPKAEPSTETEAETSEAARARAEADALWAARQEQRRAEINAAEAPIVARLNARVAARQEAAARENEEARLAWERRVAEMEAEARASEAAHRAALEAHRREVARQRAEHERRVALCLQGEREFCAQQ